MPVNRCKYLEVKPEQVLGAVASLSMLAPLEPKNSPQPQTSSGFDAPDFDKSVLGQEGSPIQLVELDGQEVKVHHLEARNADLIRILFWSEWLIEGEQRDRVDGLEVFAMQLGEVEKQPLLKVGFAARLVFAVDHHRYSTARWCVGTTQKIDADNYVHCFTFSYFNLGEVLLGKDF